MTDLNNFRKTWLWAVMVVKWSSDDPSLNLAEDYLEFGWVVCSYKVCLPVGRRKGNYKGCFQRARSIWLNKLCLELGVISLGESSPTRGSNKLSMFSSTERVLVFKVRRGLDCGCLGTRYIRCCIWWLVAWSVTRLGEFLKLLVTNFRTKVAQVFGDFLGCVLDRSLLKKNHLLLIFGYLLEKLGTFYSTVWSHWLHVNKFFPKININFYEGWKKKFTFVSKSNFLICQL